MHIHYSPNPASPTLCNTVTTGDPDTIVAGTVQTTHSYCRMLYFSGTRSTNYSGNI